MKVMTTAIAAVLMLGRRLSATQWVALAILTLGMVVMQLPGSRDAGRGAAAAPGSANGGALSERVVPRSSLSGAWAMLLSTVLSACARAPISGPSARRTPHARLRPPHSLSVRV